MEQSNAPPPEAVRGGVSRTVFAVTVVIVAIIAFVGGLGLGAIFLGGPAAPGKIIIGTNTPFPPFEFRDANDTIVGFDIDLITRILDDNGLAYELYDFRDFSALLSAVQVRRVDIVVIDLPIANRTAQQNPGTYRAAGTIQTNELYAFAVAHNDPLGLLARMNASLAKFRTPASGVYASLIAKWF